MDSENLDTDVILQELGGCGRFQIILAFVAYLPQIAFSFSMLLMSFGAYNPGWRCLDNTSFINETETHSLSVGSLEDNTSVYVSDSCRGFDACQHIEFSPEASTIVTEWNLACQNGWISSTIMSLQMVGVLIGTLMNGFLGDKFGRKLTLYSFVLLNLVVNAISISSVSWQMYIGIRFFIGITCGIIGYIPCLYITEFVPRKWRVRIASLPFWSIGSILFSVVAMVTRDWRQIHIITTVVSAVCLLPVVWVPKSLRFLVVHGKYKDSLKVARKISSLNKTKVPIEHLKEIFSIYKKNQKKILKTATILDLFKKNTIRFTIVFGALYMSMDLLYYTTSFGVSFLPGNVYVNMIIMFASELPSNLIAATVPNVFGRKYVCMACCLTQAACLFCVVAVSFHVSGQAKSVTILGLIIAARICLCVEWYVSIAYVSEVYPTVVRSTASSYGALMASVGAITAPYFIPSEPGVLYISYLIMAGLNLLCCALLILLPETKGKPLPDTFDRLYHNRDGDDKIRAQSIVRT